MNPPSVHRQSPAQTGDERAEITSRAETIKAVAQGFDALAPMLLRLLADRSISGEAAMHLVVMDPDADPHTGLFEDAILCERSFGDVATWEADYAWYARAKARVSWREQRSLRTLLARYPQRLRPEDLRVEGAVCEGRWVVGASGAQPWYDHAIASIAIHLFDATLEHVHLAAVPA